MRFNFFGSLLAVIQISGQVTALGLKSVKAETGLA